MNGKPLVTFALFAYNQEKYIRNAVQGAFAQTYSPLEIILSDDCSTDRTFKIMQKMADEYNGPHKIILNRNDKNLNIGGHVNKIGKLVTGEIVVMAAGDDISVPERTDKVVSFFQDCPEAFAVFSNISCIDNDGQLAKNQILLPRKIKKISMSRMIRNGGGVGPGAAYAYRAKCFFYPWEFPEFYNIEDRLLPLRASLLGDVFYFPAILVRYRLNLNDTTFVNSYTKLFAKYNSMYMEEISKTLKYAVVHNNLSRLKGFLYSKLVLWNPRIHKRIFVLKNKGGLLNRLQSLILSGIINFDAIPTWLMSKINKNNIQ